MTRQELETLHGSTVVFPIISEFEARYSTTCQYIDMGVRVVDRHDEAHVLTYQEIHERIGAREREDHTASVFAFQSMYQGATACSMMVQGYTYMAHYFGQRIQNPEP